MAQKKPTQIGELADYESSSALPDYEAPEPKQVIEHVTRTESTISVTDVAAAKRREDAQAMKKQINGMRKMLKDSRKIKMRPSVGHAALFGSTFTYLLNGFPITVRFDGSEQEFPEPVYHNIMEKINEGMNASAPKNVNDKIR